MSAVGHALTLHHPLRATSLGDRRFSVDGTPTDCVNLGIHSLLDFKPDLVVSGINRAANLGDDVTYSGTVSAAMEATLMGSPPLRCRWSHCLRASITGPLPSCCPGGPATAPERPSAGYLPERERARSACRPYRQTCCHRTGKEALRRDHRGQGRSAGRNYYWIGTADLRFHDIEGSDFHAVSRGHVSITPLHLDLTNRSSMSAIASWDLD